MFTENFAQLARLDQPLPGPAPCFGLPLGSAYAGIGSRATPGPELELIAALAAMLARCGLTLRSGGAPGADTAFEAGCDRAGGRKEIFLPWRGFNRNPSPLYEPPGDAYLIAREVHPRWERCRLASRKLHARNCQQILGERLCHPASFALFWAPEEAGCVLGGTGTAVSLAQRRGVPSYNLWRPEVRAQWASLVAAPGH